MLFYFVFKQLHLPEIRRHLLLKPKDFFADSAVRMGRTVDFNDPYNGFINEKYLKLNNGVEQKDKNAKIM